MDDQLKSKVDHFARVLKISDEEYQTAMATGYRWTGQKGAQEIPNMFSGLPKAERLLKMNRFFAALASRYLPRLMEVYGPIVPPYPEGPAPFTSTILAGISSTYLFARYVRSRDAEQMFRDHVGVMMDYRETVDDDEATSDPDLSPVSKFLVPTCKILFSIAMSFLAPPPDLPPRLTFHLQNHLGGANHWLDIAETVRFPNVPQLTDIRDTYARLLAFLRCANEAEWAEYCRREKVSSRFAECEGRYEVGEYVRETELPMCAKCQSVRYCSKAHQRAHWKTHKQICFRPAWD